MCGYFPLMRNPLQTPLYCVTTSLSSGLSAASSVSDSYKPRLEKYTLKKVHMGVDTGKVALNIIFIIVSLDVLCLPPELCGVDVRVVFVHFLERLVRAEHKVGVFVAAGLVLPAKQELKIVSRLLFACSAITSWMKLRSSPIGTRPGSS